MTVCKNYYARTFAKINPSRYPSRTLRDCSIFNKVGIAAVMNLWKRLETQLLVVKCLNVVLAHLNPSSSFMLVSKLACNREVPCIQSKQTTA